VENVLDQIKVHIELVHIEHANEYFSFAV